MADVTFFTFPVGLMYTAFTFEILMTLQAPFDIYIYVNINTKQSHRQFRWTDGQQLRAAAYAGNAALHLAAGRRKNEKNEEDVDYDPLQRYPDIILKTALVKKKAS